MAEKLEANQYADLPYAQIPKHPYARIGDFSRRFICSVCQRPMLDEIHQNQEPVPA